MSWPLCFLESMENLECEFSIVLNDQFTAYVWTLASPKLMKDLEWYEIGVK